MSDALSETKSHIESIENARMGYQVSVSLWGERTSELWSQFSAIVTANSIVLAAASLSIINTAAPDILAYGIPVIGLTLCVLWLFLHVRGVSFAQYYMLSARELEEKYFSSELQTVSRGGDFSSGKSVQIKIGNNFKHLRMGFLGRLILVKWVAYLIIGVFALMYLVLLILA